MRCQEVKPKIYALADGETVNGSQPALYLHLSGCPGCQEEAGRAREITRLLQHSLTQIDPPCDLRALVIPKLNDECSNASEKKFKRVGRKVLALVAGVVFLVGAGFASLASKRIAPDLAEAPPAYEERTGPQGGPQYGPAPGGEEESEKPGLEPGEKADGQRSSAKKEDRPGKGGSLPVPGTPSPGVVPTWGLMEAAGGERVYLGGGAIVYPFLASETASYVRPAWSVGGQEIWYFCEEPGSAGQYAAWKVSPDGRERAPLWPEGQGISLNYGGGVWLPTGDRVVYVSSSGGYLELRSKTVSGQDMLLTPAEGETPSRYWAYWPVVSSAGEIAYLTDRFGNIDIMVVNGEGKSWRLTDTPGRELYPSWSPGGRFIAYQYSWTDGEGRHDRVYVSTRDGKSSWPVTPDMGGDLLVSSWSPDENYLAINVGVTEARPGVRQKGIWLVSRNGGGLVQLTDLGGGNFVSWSPDGKKIAFTDGWGNMYVAHLEGLRMTGIERVTPEADAEGVSFAVWSFNSDQLLLEWRRPGTAKRGIWVVELGEKSE